MSEHRDILLKIGKDMKAVYGMMSSSDINNFLGYKLVEYKSLPKPEHLEAIIKKSMDNYFEEKYGESKGVKND